MDRRGRLSTLKIAQTILLSSLLLINQMAAGAPGMLGEPAPSLTSMTADEYQGIKQQQDQQAAPVETPPQSSAPELQQQQQQQQPAQPQQPDQQTELAPSSESQLRPATRFLKALLLGPLVGLGLKAAMIRGFVWAISAYLMHVFTPSLLTSLGLGTGLVGFARQLQPDYFQIMLTNLNGTSASKLVSQYRQLLQPVILAVETIPEGHCRFRAVCEVANNVVSSSRGFSVAIQRLSALLYTNLGTEYSRAWLDGVVQRDCATRYNQCESSPFQMVLNKLAESVRQNGLPGFPVRAPMPTAAAGSAAVTNGIPAGSPGKLSIQTSASTVVVATTTTPVERTK